MPEALVVDALRTPLLPWQDGARDAVALAATPIQGLLDRTGLAPTELSELYLGGGLGPHADLLARQVALAADLPWHLPARSVSRGDVGGLAALQGALEAIGAGTAEIVCVAAVGHPQLQPPGLEGRHGVLSSAVRWKHGLETPAQAASWWAAEKGLGETELEALVAEHLAARQAETAAMELVPTELGDDWAVEDPTPDTSWSAATPRVQGASAVLLASTERPDGPELPVRARLVGARAGAVDLGRTWGGSVVALRRLLAELVMNLDELDLVVLDAPFPACQEAARIELGLPEEAVLPGHGHLARGRLPGAPGLRALPDLLHALETRYLRYGALLAESLDGQGLCVLVDREVYF